MYFSAVFSLAVIAFTCTTRAIEKRATPTLYLVGDSTMARHSIAQGIQGCVFDNNVLRKHDLTYT